MDGQVAGLVVEHLFSPGLETLENTLDVPVIVQQVIRQGGEPSGDALGFHWHLPDMVCKGAFDPEDLPVQDLLGRLLQPYQAADEKDCSPLSQVVIGPLCLDPKMIEELAAGDLVHTGRVANESLPGIIRRENGKVWPARLTGQAARVTGDAARLSQLVAHAKPNVLADIVIGTTEIHAREIVAGLVDTTFVIRRLPANSAWLCVNGKKVATGVLETSNGNC